MWTHLVTTGHYTSFIHTFTQREIIMIVQETPYYTITIFESLTAKTSNSSNHEKEYNIHVDLKGIPEKYYDVPTPQEILEKHPGCPASKRYYVYPTKCLYDTENPSIILNKHFSVRADIFLTFKYVPHSNKHVSYMVMWDSQSCDSYGISAKGLKRRLQYLITVLWPNMPPVKAQNLLTKLNSELAVILYEFEPVSLSLSE